MTPKVPLRHYMLMKRRRQLLEEICPFWGIICCMLCLKCPTHLLTLYAVPLSIEWAAKGPVSMCMAYIGHVEHGRPRFLYRLSAVFLASLGL